MRYFYLDASAWVKRYADEPGSAAVSLLMDRLLSSQPLCFLISWMGLLEVVSVLNRHRNAGRLAEGLFRQALARLTDEATHMNLLPFDGSVAARSLPLLLNHNLNASDALYLRQMLDWQADRDPMHGRLTLVSTDERLLRAAQSEELLTLNPEIIDLDTVATLLTK